jgi:hypothetical protein
MRFLLLSAISVLLAWTPLGAEEAKPLSQLRMPYRQATALYAVYQTWMRDEGVDGLRILEGYNVVLGESEQRYTIQFDQISRTAAQDRSATYGLEKQNWSVHRPPLAQSGEIRLSSTTLSGTEAAAIVAALTDRRALPPNRKYAYTDEAGLVLGFWPRGVFVSIYDMALIRASLVRGQISLGCYSEEMYRVDMTALTATRWSSCYM